MSFGDLYSVPSGQGNPPGLPSVELPQIEARPRRPLQIEVRKERPSEAEAYGFVKGAPPPGPAAAAEPDDMSGFVKGAPPEMTDAASPRNVPLGEAVGRGAISGATFGAAPAMAGVQAAGLDWLPTDIQKLFAGHEHEPTVGAFLLGLARLAKEGITGEKGGLEAYRGRRDEVRKAQEEAQAQHPVGFFAGEIPPTLAMPLGAMGGATGLGRIGASIGAGALGGGLNELGGGISKGEGLGELAKSTAAGAATGAGLGAVGGTAVEGLGALGSRVMSLFRGTRSPENEAARRVAEALRSDYERAGGFPVGPQERAAAQASGMPTALVDYGGERTRALARSAANTSPEAREVLTDLVQQRFAQQAPRLGGFVRGLVGGGHAADDIEALRIAAQRANRPAYARAYAAGNRPIWSPEIEQLVGAPAVRQAMAGAIERGQNRAVSQGFGAFNPGMQVTPDGRILFQRGRTGVPTYPNIQFWDYVQRELRDAAGTASRAGRNEEAGAIGSLRRQLVDRLDAMVPEFGAARRGAATFFNGAENGLEAGENFVMQNASIPDARRALARLSPPDRELFARGFASRLADTVERTRDNVNVINSIFMASPAARQKVEMALGAPRARQLEAMLRVEAIADRARGAVTGNSTTMRQLAEHGMAGAGAVGGLEALMEHGFNPIHLATAAITGAIMRHVAGRVDERTARQVGEMLASNDPAVLRRGVQIVANSPRYFEALRRATAGGERLAEEHVGPANTAAAASAGMLRLLEGPPEKPHEVHNQDWYNNPQ